MNFRDMRLDSIPHPNEKTLLNAINPRSTSLTANPLFDYFTSLSPMAKPAGVHRSPLHSAAPRPSVADGHQPPFTVEPRYANDTAVADTVSEQRAMMLQQQELWRQSERAVREGLQSGSSNNAFAQDATSTLDEMLREYGVLPVPGPAGVGAGWDSVLCGWSKPKKASRRTAVFPLAKRVRRRVTKEASTVLWEGWIWLG